MIGKLKGKLTVIEGNIGLIETLSGVYYKVFLPPTIIREKKISDNIEVYTFLQVREDALNLFGFEDKKQFRLFEMLLSVDGIGPKSAFTVISFANPEKIFKAVEDNDLEFFCSIPSIGRKTAQKILLELSGKLGKSFDLRSLKLTEDDTMVVDALASLGFKKFEAARIIQKLDKKLPIEERIREGIRMMTSKARN